MTQSRLINQKTYEHIVYSLRRHFVTFIPAIALFLALLAAPGGLYYIVKTSGWTILENPTAYAFIMMGLSVYLLSICLFFYTYFNTFYLDIWIITNDRLVDVRQNSLFSRTVAELDLYKIQDVTSEVKGVFASLFNYGNVYLQTAGSIPRFVIYNVSDPHYLRQRILELSAADKQYHSKNG